MKAINMWGGGTSVCSLTGLRGFFLDQTNLEGVQISGEVPRNPGASCRTTRMRLIQGCILPLLECIWDGLQHPPRDPAREKKQTNRQKNIKATLYELILFPRVKV